MEALAHQVGYFVLAVGLFRAMPQILKVVRSGSAQGLSLGMFALELAAFLVYLFYGFRKPLPQSTYLEFTVLTVQGSLLYFMIIHHSYGFGSSKGVVACLAYVGTVVLFYTVPFAMLEAMWRVIIPISVFKTVPQIVANYKAKSTGQLSWMFVLMAFTCTACRIFTTIVLVGDPTMLACYLGTTTFNAITLSQIWFYSRKQVKARTE
mmetsp:Transcript_28917/g.68242  ORF Transcript_28917/g.68242 Transcript_28917/m.68242 type:complete len:207 (+) Transcript_28917:11-631(+)